MHLFGWSENESSVSSIQLELRKLVSRTANDCVCAASLCVSYHQTYCGAPKLVLGEIWMVVAEAVRGGSPGRDGLGYGESNYAGRRVET